MKNNKKRQNASKLKKSNWSKHNTILQKYYKFAIISLQMYNKQKYYVYQKRQNSTKNKSVETVDNSVNNFYNWICKLHFFD